VRQRRHGDGLHILRRDEIAPVQQRLRARELEQRQCAARARTDLGALARARRGDEIDDVVADGRRDMNLLERALQLEQPVAIRHRAELLLVHSTLDTLLEHRPLVVAPGIADAQSQEEAIELGLRQRIRALVLDRILCRDHEERTLELIRVALDGHLPLLHRLEQRSLCLRRRAVDLVAEQQVGEDRPRTEFEVAGALVEDGRAGHIGRHQIRGELDARERHVERLRERTRDQCLRQSREVLDQHVTVGQEAEQHELERLALADDGALDLVEHALGLRPGLFDGGQIASSSSTTSRSSGTLGPTARRFSGGGRSGRTSSQHAAPTSSRAREGSASSSTP
jgi:hypothetical protein